MYRKLLEGKFCPISIHRYLLAHFPSEGSKKVSSDLELFDFVFSSGKPVRDLQVFKMKCCFTKFHI